LVIVRRRTESDLDECVEIARLVHQVDGYPLYLPTDLHTFLVSPDAYGAWVAEEGGQIVGHVALHPRSTDVALRLACDVLGQPVDRLGIVARLLVAPSGRRRGVGRALLEEAAGEALTRGLWPILDVATQLTPAIQLYERCGWIPVGDVTVQLGGDFTLEERVYRGPEQPTESR
jgi:GNAT superfamily N-acetyltransferase